MNCFCVCLPLLTEVMVLAFVHNPGEAWLVDPGPLSIVFCFNVYYKTFPPFIRYQTNKYKYRN